MGTTTTMGRPTVFTSRANLDWEAAPAGADIDSRNRNVGIYRLQADWREAMFLFKRNG